MKLIFTFFLLAAVHIVNAQVGIGTATPDQSAQLEILSSDKGILIPRVTQVNRPGSPGKIAPVEGLLIYQIDNDPGFYYYDGANWNKIVKKSDRPSNSFAGKNQSLTQTISGYTATPIQFNSMNLSVDVTGNAESTPTAFTVQTTGLYHISYSIQFNGNSNPWTYILPSDNTLANQLYIASLDYMPSSSAGILKGQATVQLTALTSLQLIIQSTNGLSVLTASLSITKL